MTNPENTTKQEVAKINKAEAIVAAGKAVLESGGPICAIIPSNTEEAWRLAVAMQEAGMVPDSYSKNQNEKQTKARVMIGIMKGLEIGLAPITALSTIVIINNRPCVWGDGAMALIQNSGNLVKAKEWMEGVSGTPDWTAHCELWRKDQDESYHRTFTWAQAQKANLVSKPGPWITYPVRMMQMRARAYALRDGFADALYGLSIGEEVRDIPVTLEKPSTDFLSDEKPALPSPEPGIQGVSPGPVDAGADAAEDPEPSAADASPETAGDDYGGWPGPDPDDMDITKGPER